MTLLCQEACTELIHTPTCQVKKARARDRHYLGCLTLPAEPKDSSPKELT